MTTERPDPAEHLGLARHAAQRHIALRPWQAHLFDDLVAAAVLAICEAVEHYDAEQGEFAPYAYRCARHAAERTARLLACGVRVPHGSRPAPTTSLDTGVYEDVPLMKFLASPGPSPEDAAQATEAPAVLAAILSGLHGQARDVLERRLAGETLAVIGAALGLTKQRVQQIEAHAIRRLAARVRREAA